MKQRSPIAGKEQMHPEDRRNLVIFLMLALLIWFGFDHFVIKPRMEATRAQQAAAALAAEQEAVNLAAGISAPQSVRPRAEVLADSPRLAITTESVSGSLAISGNRIDDIALVKYKRELNGTDNVVLLEPAGTENPQYAEYGWLGGENVAVPGKDTRWQVPAGAKLTAQTPVTMTWDNGQGLVFSRTISIDDDYMIHVAQKVTNNTSGKVTLYPYALVGSDGLPAHMENVRAVHEGPLGYIGGHLEDYTYRDMSKKKINEEFTADTGWIGITQKFWLTSVFLDQKEPSKFRFNYTPAKSDKDKEHYQVDVMGAARTIEPGAEASANVYIFAGAKEVKILQAYADDLGISHFDLAVDFGLFYFLTKPFFYILHFFGHLFGNFGIAIICLTVIVRLCVFPLASASFRSFAKLKKISPMMTEIRERYGDDREALQKELVKLYEREKVNPMAGCLPIVIQIPIFFALYKILMVTIEMRHAPFFGWIHDLSVKDPTTVFNLFGLIPWNPPAPLMIGAWPCMMLFFMVLQKKLNPPPQDKMQKTMMDIMPYFLTYIMSGFAAGLVVYWTFSNALSIVQQYVIMRSMGVQPHLFRSRKEKELEKAVEEGPTVHPELALAEKKAEEALFGEEDAPKVITPPKPRKKKKK